MLVALVEQLTGKVSDGPGKFRLTIRHLNLAPFTLFQPRAEPESKTRILNTFQMSSRHSVASPAARTSARFKRLQALVVGSGLDNRC